MTLNTDLPISLGILAITIYFLPKRRMLTAVGRSHMLVSAGLVVVCLSSFLETLFLGAQPLLPVIARDDDMLALLGLFGYLPGLVLIIAGLRQWLPALSRLDEEIGRRKAAEQAARRQTVEVMEASLQADLANRAKSRFLAHMSHELRTPLNAILGFSEMLQLAPFGPIGDARYLGYAGDINRSGKHLLRLVNDVLDLSKIDAGLEELNEERLCLHEVAREAESLFRPGFDKADLAFHVDHASLEADLMFDRTKLSRILINLLGNAIKFTPPGGAVWLYATPGTEGGLGIVVRDNGVGMTPQQIEVAMSTFGQADNRIRRENEGSGLGLPIVKSLCELHGGRFDIDSLPGRGTSVTVQVPAQRVLQLQAGAGAPEHLRDSG